MQNSVHIQLSNLGLKETYGKKYLRFDYHLIVVAEDASGVTRVYGNKLQGCRALINAKKKLYWQLPLAFGESKFHRTTAVTRDTYNRVLAELVKQKKLMLALDDPEKDVRFLSNVSGEDLFDD